MDRTNLEFLFDQFDDEGHDCIGGTAIAVSDDEMMQAGVRLASDDGVFVAPEGAACIAAMEKLLASGFLQPDERMVIYNTGAGLKYLEAYSALFPRD